MTTTSNRQKPIAPLLRVLAAVTLLVAALSPALAAASSTASGTPNDIIFGGLGTQHPRATLLKIYDQDHDKVGHGGYHQLFAHFGIDRNDLATTVDGSVHSSNSAILSVGRTSSPADIQSFTAGGTTVYHLRPLDSFGSNVTYAAVIGHRHGDNAWFAILDSCGNIEMMASAPAPAPAPKPAKSMTMSSPHTNTMTQMQTAPPASPPASATANATASSTVNVVQIQGQEQSQEQSPTQEQPQQQSQTMTPAPASPATTAQAAPTPAPAPAPAATPAAATTASTTLPQTGATTTAGMVGISSLLVAAWYYRRSRQGLLRAFLKHQ